MFILANVLPNDLCLVRIQSCNTVQPVGFECKCHLRGLDLIAYWEMTFDIWWFLIKFKFSFELNLIKKDLI